MNIYLLRNLVNGKQYVGQTKHQIKSRFYSHCHCAKKGSRLPIAAAIRKYGRHNFSVELLEQCNSQEATDAAEKAWIKQTDSLVPHGYNISDGGSGKGRDVSVSTKKKLSQRVFTLEWRRKLSESRKSVMLSSKQLAALAQGRNNPALIKRRALSQRGDGNGRSKLTWDKVRAIRRMYGTGGYSQQRLADLFGVKQVTISRIVLGTSWK